MLNYVFENLNFTTDNPSLIPLVIHNKNYLLDLMTMLNSTPKR